MKKITKLKKTNTIKDSLKLLKGQFGMIICIVEKNDILIGV